jgi:hypothetical protein
MSFTRGADSCDDCMSAEIYAVGDETNSFDATFTSADGLGGHNISRVTSNYTTYEGSNVSNSDGFDGLSGENVFGPSAVTIDVTVTAWETDNNQSIEVCYEDAGDFWGYDKDGACASTASFTGSEETLHNPYTYAGWHIFGAPMYTVGNASITEVFAAGLPDYSNGSDYVVFTQTGQFVDIWYNFGQAYFFGLNHELVSFSMQGRILSSANGLMGDQGETSTHALTRGWNLLSPKLVRPVDADMLQISDGGETYTWAEAQTLGIVSGEVIGTDAESNFYSESFDPWNGFWLHASQSCDLVVEPHGFDLAKEKVENDYFSWNLNIQAVPVDGEGIGDIIKLGLSDKASNDILDGEDTEDIPVMTMTDSYLDLYMQDANGMRYFKNTKAMITPDQGQAWTINGYSEKSLSDIRLSWTMDEIDEAYDIRMFISGDEIDMRAQTSVVISTEVLNSITVIVGNDPLALGLTTPTEFALNAAYPNPFNPVTSMQLALNIDGYTTIKVYNLMGQIVDVIHEGLLQKGFHQISWNAVEIPSGVYLVQVEQGDKLATQKVMLMK